MVGIVALLGYGMFLSSVPPLTYGPLQSLFPSEARPGETVTLMRDLTYTRDATVSVTRYLTTTLPDGRVLHIELGENVGERAAGFRHREEHHLSGIQYRSGFRHELDAAEDDHFGVSPDSRLREGQAVPAYVGDLLDLGALVIVGQDDRVLLAGQLPDLGGEGNGIGVHGGAFLRRNT